jgi:hypothetical protein
MGEIIDFGEISHIQQMNPSTPILGSFCVGDTTSDTGCKNGAEWLLTLYLHDDAGHTRMTHIRLVTDDTLADEFRPIASASIIQNEITDEQVIFDGTKTVGGVNWPVYRAWLPDTGNLSISFDASESYDPDAPEGEKDIELYEWKVYFDYPWDSSEPTLEGHVFQIPSAAGDDWTYVFRNLTSSPDGNPENQIRIELIVYDIAGKQSEKHRMYFIIAGVGTVQTYDRDGDGYSDFDESVNCDDGSAYASSSDPLDPTDMPSDMDGDYRCDALDGDRDGDRVNNDLDAFPDDYNEWVDTDGDGTGNNADTDDDGDGTPDSEDDFPLDECADIDYDDDGQADSIVTNCSTILQLDLDLDQDGLNDIDDDCPKGARWWNRSRDDHDGDGCHDSVEDEDDDDDGILDSVDKCARGDLNWSASSVTDHDTDGCQDAGEDMDDDDDSVFDVHDDCPRGILSWTSTLANDRDGDGCRDADEDVDDDNDGIHDTSDSCTTGVLGWTSNSTSDNDSDGCRDSDEDDDDDNDGWLDSMDIRPLDPEIQTEWDLLRDYIPWALASIILIVALSALIVLRKRRSRVDSVPEKKVENRAMEDYVQQMIAMGHPEEYARNYAMQFADQFESQSKN